MMISQWLMHHDGLEAVDPVELRGEPRWQGRRFAWPPPLFPLRRRAPLPALLLLRRLPPAIHRLVIRLPPPRQPSPVATGGNVRRRRAQDRECQHLVHHRRRRRRDRTTSRRKTWRVGLNFASNLWLLALLAQVANGGERDRGLYILVGGERICVVIEVDLCVFLDRWVEKIRGRGGRRGGRKNASVRDLVTSPRDARDCNSASAKARVVAWISRRLRARVPCRQRVNFLDSSSAWTAGRVGPRVREHGPKVVHMLLDVNV